jgi:hypothetical protein
MKPWQRVSVGVTSLLIGQIRFENDQQLLLGKEQMQMTIDFRPGSCAVQRVDLRIDKVEFVTETSVGRKPGKNHATFDSKSNQAHTFPLLL